MSILDRNIDVDLKIGDFGHISVIAENPMITHLTNEFGNSMAQAEKKLAEFVADSKSLDHMVAKLHDLVTYRVYVEMYERVAFVCLRGFHHKIAGYFDHMVLFAFVMHKTEKFDSVVISDCSQDPDITYAKITHNFGCEADWHKQHKYLITDQLCQFSIKT